MTFLECPGYGINSQRVTIVCERIVSFRLIDYNGNYGVEIDLDTGKSVCVGMWPHDFENAVTKALEGA